MAYNEAKAKAEMYPEIIGKAILNKMYLLDSRKITSLPVSPALKIKEVFNEWWCNGNDNNKAVTKMELN